MSSVSKILVTGAAGFIGFHLSKRLLDEGEIVVGIDNLNDYYDVSLKKDRLCLLEASENFRFFQVDIADQSTIKRLFKSEGFNKVVNLAAQVGVRYSLENAPAYVESNITGLINILEGCRQNNVEHLVFASSSSVYGLNTKKPSSVTDRVDHPISIYAASKKAGEVIAHTYSHLYQLPCTGIRFFSVYGPWGRPDMAYFIFTKAIINEQPFDVFNYGSMRRDFTYIDDIVKGIVSIIDKVPLPDPNWIGENPKTNSSSAPYRLYNIGNSQPVKLMRFINLIEEQLGKKAVMNLEEMQAGDILENFADTKNLERDIGFKPSTLIETGIKYFVNWYRDYYGQ